MGNAERRLEGDMAGESCKWEEQYGAGRLEDTQTACRCQIGFWCFFDVCMRTSVLRVCSGK